MDGKAVSETIVIWLNDRIECSKLKGFVVGVSGGIDSALVSTLCAMTGKPTYVVTMPIKQAQDQEDRGKSHIKWLVGKYGNVDDSEVPLDEVFDSITNALYDTIAKDDLAMANTRARLRMTTLYAYAGHFGCLVAGTGNKVEDFGIGFFTKYGDGGVDISPIGDLSKTQVRELATYLGVSQEIVTAKPTDGLWADGRGDEDQIGASYEELEWAMAYYDRSNTIMGLTGSTERQKEVMDIYKKRHYANEHKMKMPPICEIPKIIL